MTQPRKGAEYGLPYLYDAIPIGDPRAAMSFKQGNRLCDDVAQMTRVAMRAWVVFPTSTGGAGSITPTMGKSQMGVAGVNLPTVAKTSTGLYTIAYPSTWTDGAGTDATGVGQAESIVLVAADGCVQSTTVFGRVQCVASNQTITVAVLANNAGVDTLSDLTNGTLIFVRCWS